jgi:hypothetical protein
MGLDDNSTVLLLIDHSPIMDVQKWWISVIFDFFLGDFTRYLMYLSAKPLAVLAL